MEGEHEGDSDAVRPDCLVNRNLHKSSRQSQDIGQLIWKAEKSPRRGVRTVEVTGKSAS